MKEYLRTINIIYEQMPELQGVPIETVVNNLFAEKYPMQNALLVIYYIVSSGYRFSKLEDFEKLRKFPELRRFFIWAGYRFSMDDLLVFNQIDPLLGRIVAGYMQDLGFEFSPSEFEILGLTPSERGKNFNLDGQKYPHKLVYIDDAPCFIVANEIGNKIEFVFESLAGDVIVPENKFIIELKCINSEWMAELQDIQIWYKFFYWLEKLTLLEFVDTLNLKIHNKQEYDFVYLWDLSLRISINTCSYWVE